MQHRQPDDPGLIRVRGNSLTEALRRVRREHGADARIVGSRSVYARDDAGLGRRREIEVLVAGEDAPAAPARGPGDLAAALAVEVERLEATAASLARRLDDDPEQAEDPEIASYELAAPLRAAGADEVTVARLAGLHAAEGGTDPLRHLASQLPTCGGDWADVAGVHLFLGETGAGKTELVLGAAARLRDAGRRVLVLHLMPRHEGEIARLQHEAAAHAYDAAVIRECDQLERAADHFAGYDAVLIDTPALDAPPLLGDDETRARLVDFEATHRHLVVPLDAEDAALAAAAGARRDWNCDWIAATRLDRARRPGRLAGLLAGAGVPLSLAAAGRWPETAPGLPESEDLVRRVLGVAVAEGAAAGTD